MMQSEGVRMKLLGLTGGIGSGKSTISRMLAELGAKVIDADSVSRELSRPGGKVYEAILSTFGEDYRAQDGTIDRAKLAALVFGDAKQLKKLNEVTHPLIVQAMWDEVQRYKEQPFPPEVVVLDVPLLIETGMHKGVDAVWLAVCEECVKIKRIMLRDKCTKDEALKRINSQATDAQRMPYATAVIDNSSALEQTKKTVTQLYRELCEE
ncbi:dephospho-CoA kinase [Clostridia bacterium OttesenSCG-928-F22]|nr:dephospho-CoA kinase [Clostridia bacterium OttesenSCG-928-F22]